MATTLYLVPGSSFFCSITDLMIYNYTKVRLQINNKKINRNTFPWNLQFDKAVVLFGFGGRKTSLRGHWKWSKVSDTQFTFSQFSLEQYLRNNPIMRRWILARGPLSCNCSCPSSLSVVRVTSVSPMLHTIPVTRPSSCSEPHECTACRSWRMLMKTSTWDTTKCKTCNQKTLLFGITSKHIKQYYV